MMHDSGIEPGKRDPRESGTPHQPGTRPVGGGWAAWVATFGGAGYAPKAPGTVGTLAALPLAVGLQWLGWPWQLVALLILIPLGIRAIDGVEAAWDTHDPKQAVIDEVAGIILTFVGIPLEWGWTVAGFLLFRVLDIGKPGPVGWCDRQLPGGWGVMADDLVAGGLACLILHTVWWMMNG